jgi:transcriptional regulator with XRE-family HTH domain
MPTVPAPAEVVKATFGRTLDVPRFDFELGRRGRSAREFSQLAGISEVTLSRVRHGRPMTPGTLRKITAALLGLPLLPGADLVLSEPGRVERR